MSASSAASTNTASGADGGGSTNNNGKEALLGILKMCLQPSTSSAGWKKLKMQEKLPATLTHLLAIIQDVGGHGSSSVSGDVSESNEDIRELCLEILDKKTQSLFPKLSGPAQLQFRNNLLAMVRNGVCSPNLSFVIQPVAVALDKMDKDWPELFQMITDCSAVGTYPTESSALLACGMIYQACNAFGDKVAPYTSNMATAVVNMCVQFNAPGNQVISRLAPALLILMLSLQKHKAVLQLKPLIPHVMSVCILLSENGMHEEAGDLLRFFQIASAIKFPFLDDSFETVSEQFLALVSSNLVPDDLCGTATEIFESLMKNRTYLFHSLPLLTRLLARLKQSAVAIKYTSGERVNVIARHVTVEVDTTGETESTGLNRHLHFMDILNRLTKFVPARYVLQLILDDFAATFRSSSDEDEKRFACDLIASTVEGLRDSFRQHLAQLVPMVLGLVADPSVVVREGALYALTRLCEHGWPEIFHYHATILPSICVALGDEANIFVQAEACEATELFVEQLSKDTLRPYLQQLLLLLGNILTSSQPMVVSMSLIAIGTLAVSTKEDFLPYMDAILSFLQPLLFDGDPTHSEVRVQAMVVLGQMARAVGKERFAPHFGTGLASVSEEVVSNNLRLLECRYIYYSNTAKTMGEDLAAYLPQMTPDLLARITEPEPQQNQGDVPLDSSNDDDDEDEAEGESDSGSYDDEDDADQEEESPFDDEQLELQIANKRSALTAAANIAEHAPLSFYPLLDEFANGMMANQLFQHHEGELAGLAHFALGSFAKCVCVANGIRDQPKPGEAIHLSDIVVSKLKQYLQLCLTAMSTSDNKQVVSRSCEAVANMMDTVGCSLLRLTIGSTPAGESLLTHILTLLQEKARCQQETSEDDDGVDSESDDSDNNYDSSLLDDVLHLVASVAKAVGHGFLPHFDVLLPHIAKFTDESRLHIERSQAVGCLSECLDVLGPDCVKHAPTLLKIFSEGLRDQSTINAVRRNSAYALGMFVRSTGTRLVPQFGELLQWLHPICIRPANQGYDAGGADVDNALSAVCHIIRASPENVPLSLVLPVILAALPIREDYSEAINIYKCFHELLMTSNPAAISCLTPILSLFGMELLVSTKRTCLNALPSEFDDISPKELVTSQLKSLATTSTSMRDLLLAAVHGVHDELVKQALTEVLTA
jgi:hypothetical protein